MSFTGRIRTYLVAIALLPPVLMMAVVYFYSERQQELAYRQRAAEDLQKLVRYRSLFRQELVGTLERVLASSWFILSVHAVRSGGVGAISVDAQQFDLDFLELLDSSNIVLGSSHRPGLVGEKMELYDALDPSEQVVLQETVEYDIKGRHAALTGLAVGEQEFRLYGGLYLSRRFQPTANQIVRGTTAVIYSDDPGGESRRFSGMEFGSLYQSENTYEAVLSGGGEIGFHMIARFEPTEMTPVFNSFMNVVGLVALVSVLGAIALGVYISGRARREIDNLVDAFTRVAAGDLSTAVMAYEEGEFAQLADSFSEMMQKLRDSQNKLATSEKIAAWQTMARKIAHEIKNPLTPIGISVDDLRRSHQQKLPHFDQTVESSTRMIRSEVDRLCRLLDQFVSFARMSPPVISEISTDELLHDLEMLYAAEIESGTLAITVQTGRTTVRVDPAQIKQVLVNLIKNSLEAAEGATVEVAAADSPESLRLSVFDNGPGFSEHVLGHSFEPYVSSKKDGSGLGLVICQRIVHDHGGTIQLSNKPEGGAAVIILLPQN